MSGLRRSSDPWFSDHVIFSSYRWFSWGIAVLVSLWQGGWVSYGWMLLFTGVCNVPVTLFARRYLQVVRHNPAVMVLDIFYAVVVVSMVLPPNGSPSWVGPFVLYPYSSLVLPALLLGWRGGLMAGLFFVTLHQSVLWIVSNPPSNWVNVDRWGVLVFIMVAPPVFGCVFPVLIERLRAMGGRRRRNLRRTPPVGDTFVRTSPPERLRFVPFERGVDHPYQEALVKVPVIAEVTAIRASEMEVDHLRQVLFAPFPALDMELGPVLELLALRLRMHTGIDTQVSLLGRTRYVRRSHRGVLVRLAQEALLNVQQHAHASAVVLTLRYDAMSVVLMVQDDGVGLLDGTHERPRLHALRAMHYRFVEFGGRLDVFATEGGGVTVRATVPLE